MEFRSRLSRISIHAPHEGVRLVWRCIEWTNQISIHAPHEGVRRYHQRDTHGGVIFQSTHPTRGCDSALPSLPHGTPFQSTHPTRGCDVYSCASSMTRRSFQSTHPTRGCDSPSTGRRLQSAYFNPRTPRGGATAGGKEAIRTLKFQSTHPTRGCDVHAPGNHQLYQISIHAPHEGVRPRTSKPPMQKSNFNPRTPRGGATGVVTSSG